MTDNPFVSGARVARSTRYQDGYTEQFVDKVHKSGRFTLRGSKQQWRPYRYGNMASVDWRATQTGEGWTRDSLRIWDVSTDVEINAEISAASRKRRASALRLRFERVPLDQFSDPMLDAIEAVLP